MEKNDFENLEFLSFQDEVKFVILNRKDYDWSKETIRKYQIDQIANILFSPVFDQLELKTLAEWILQDELPVRLQTQLHKIIWGKEAIGV